jgi:hypothetical protein
MHNDDQVLFVMSPESLQSMLNDAFIYCYTWGLKVNTSKTKVMIFEKGRTTNFSFYINDTQLEILDSF